MGASGMLGHKLVQRLSSRFEVVGTVRGSISPAAASIFERSEILTGVLAEDVATVEKAIAEVRPEVVVNAIGIIKQLDAASSPVPAIGVNALFPHQLAEICERYGARLVQISTDCVFSGKKGGYLESDLPDAEDLYGRSKLLGEVTGPGTITLRTSIVGRELSGTLGLFEWFLSQRGGSVRGFPHAVFSGLTTYALADLIADLIETRPEMEGLWHVSSSAIDKFSLLTALNEELEFGVGIEPDESVRIDRSLISDRFWAQLDLPPPSWPEMLRAFANDDTPYEEIRAVT